MIKPQHNDNLYSCGLCFCDDCNEERRMAKIWSDLIDLVFAGSISLEEANKEDG